MIQKDKEGYKDPGHSLKKFDTFRKEIEQKRLRTKDCNEIQVKVYGSMLDYLQGNHRQPTEVEQFILSVIKIMLEEGWAITENDFYIMMESIDIDEQVNGESRGLLKILRNSLGIKKDEYKDWLRSKGATISTRKQNVVEAISPKVTDWVTPKMPSFSIQTIKV